MTLELTIDQQGVARLFLNRPDKHNAFDDQLIEKLLKAIDDLSDDDDVRLLLLGSHGKHFSAGADLEWMQRMARFNYQDNLADSQHLAQLMHQLYHFPKPSIARVQGSAFGGALGLIACCDIAIAASNASFCLSETRIGLIPAVISPFIVKAMGARAAQRYAMTAQRFQADEAHRLGLVHEVVTDENLNEAIETLIQQLQANGPNAVRESKRLIRDVDNAPIDKTLLKETARRIAETRVSPEGQEGLSAFLEKRKPGWQTSSNKHSE